MQRCRVVKGPQAEYRAFMCPGCDDLHVIPITGPKAWGYNGSMDRPTFTPSVLVHANPPNPKTGWPGTPRCHSFVRDGRINYGLDSTHALRGQTVDLPEVADE